MTKSLTIDGVSLSPRKRIYDDRGAIFHMLRNDDPEFEKFGEIYFSLVYPNVVKGWHFHKVMTLNYCLVQGSIRLVLFDERPESKTKGVLQEITLHESCPLLVTVPPGVWNGFKGLGTTASLVANCSTHPHDPDEILRKPPTDPMFKYDWSQRHG